MRQAARAEGIREAAEPHYDRGTEVLIDLRPKDDAHPSQPVIARRPEIIHGLRNLVQNAVDFAQSTVWVDAMWTETTIELRIIDDGPGFPSDLLGRIGDPFVRRRRTAEDRAMRPEYEGMGLGLFIAKTLLERSGAELSFANGADYTQASAGRTGAVVEVGWVRAQVEQDAEAQAKGLGENVPIDI